MRLPGDRKTRWITAEEAEMEMDGQAGGCTSPFSSPCDLRLKRLRACVSSKLGTISLQLVLQDPTALQRLVHLTQPLSR